MSLDVTINYKNPKKCNYGEDHPYSSYSGENYGDCEEDRWSANITHNLTEMADHVPVGDTTLYKVCWRPDEMGISTVGEILPLLIEGIHYMVDHRKELEPYNPPNKWGSYVSFMKFLLNYKQACEDNEPDCKITVWR